MIVSLGDGSLESVHLAGKDMPDPSKTWQPSDWTRFEGLIVGVHKCGELIDQGRVEAVTKDGCVLWLAQDGNSHRRLVEKLPGIEVSTIHLPIPLTARLMESDHA